MFDWSLLAVWVLAICGTPVATILGWWKWLNRVAPLNLWEHLSLASLTLATSSVLLAIGSLIYAHVIGGFPFYDPLLMRIYRWGVLLSMSGVMFGLAAIGKRSPIRWYAPVAALGSLAFWIIAANGE